MVVAEAAKASRSGRSGRSGKSGKSNWGRKRVGKVSGRVINHNVVRVESDTQLESARPRTREMETQTDDDEFQYFYVYPGTDILFHFDSVTDEMQGLSPNSENEPETELNSKGDACDPTCEEAAD